MNAFHIKVCAIVCMVISHVGIFFFPEVTILRIVGSIAFPLFAWLIANGARHTTNTRAYLTRLLVFALISQAPFAFANNLEHTPFAYLNVFFTLFLGLLAIVVFQRTNIGAYRALAVLLCVFLAMLLNTDYGAAGVLSIVAFYVFFDRFRLMTLSQTVILGVLPLFSYVLSLYYGASVGILYTNYPLEGLGLISLLLISSYTGEKGPGLKYFFYVFYPLHYAVIALIQRMLA